MKLSKYREKSNEYTAKASEITRQLSLAGIAIIWIFKSPNNQTPVLDKFLIIPLIFLVLALLIDLGQYVIGGQIWINFFKEKERENNSVEPDPEVGASPKKNRVIYVFYYAKIVLMIFSYFFIIGYLINVLL